MKYCYFLLQLILQHPAIPHFPPYNNLNLKHLHYWWAFKFSVYVESTHSLQTVSSSESHHSSLSATCAEATGESGFFAHTLDAPLHAVIMGSTLYRAMHALIEEDTKILNTSASVAVHAMAEIVCRWLITHPKETTSMEKKINSMLQKCMPKSRSLKQHQMWSCYHKLRISSEYATVWKQFLDGIAGENPAHFPKVYHYVGHFMFKEKVKSHYAIDMATSGNADDYGLTCYALRYSAGYVLRTLRRNARRKDRTTKLYW